MMFFTRAFIVLLVQLIVAFQLSAAEAPLSKGAVEMTSNGAPRAIVIVAANPTRAAQLAAKELQYHVRLVTGAELPIVREGSNMPPAERSIYVGESEATRRQNLRSADFRAQEHLVRVTGPAVFLIGHDTEDYGDISYEANGAWPGIDLASPDFDVGTLYAVYDFLERECGVRWYMVTDLGTAYEKKVTLAVAPVERRQTPWTTYRMTGNGTWSKPGTYGRPDALGYMRNPHGAGARDGLLYLLRTRQTRASFNYNTHTLAHYNKHAAADHPDWFVDGKPGPDVQLRLWKDEVVDQVAADIRAYWRKPMSERIKADGDFCLGRGDICSVNPLDNRNFGADCRPPADTNRVGKGFGNGVYSDYWFTFVNRVAAKVKKEHPGKWIAVSAYAGFFEPPTFPMESNVGVQVAMADSGYEPDGYAMQTLKAWRAKVRRLFIYEYCYWKGFPETRPRETAAYIKRLKDLGVEGWNMELISNADAAPHHLDYYVLSKLLFDADAGVERILAEYYRLFYGPAEKPMKAFWEELMRESSTVRTWDLENDLMWAKVGASSYMAEQERRLAEAESLAVAEPYASRVRVIRMGLYNMLAERIALASSRYGRGKRLACPWLADTSNRLETLVASEAFVTPNGQSGLPRTTVKAARDNQNLYLVVDCAEPRAESIKAVCTKHDDPAIAKDDAIEIALDVGRTHRTYGHLVVNTLGTVFDEKVTATLGTTWRDVNIVVKTDRDRVWESGAQAVVAKNAQGWSLKLTIPLDQLCVASPAAKDSMTALEKMLLERTGEALIAEGEAWGFNVARLRPSVADPEREPPLTMWAPTFESFNYPDSYGVLVMRPADTGDKPMIYYDFEDDFVAAGRVKDRAGVSLKSGDVTFPGILKAGQNGVPWGVANRTEGVKGQGITFLGDNATPQYLDADLAKGVNVSNDDFTVAFWYRPVSSNGFLVGSTVDSQGINPSWTMTFNSNTLLQAVFSSPWVAGERGPAAGYHSVEAAKTLAEPRWHHIVLMVDRGRNVRVYLDRKLVISDRGNSARAVRVPFLNRLSIGCYRGSANGSMDEFKVFQGTFGQNEVDRWYAECAPAK